ncbi:MAG: hypothetical protein AAGE52_24960 [Myxococcota bacterium]
MTETLTYTPKPPRRKASWVAFGIATLWPTSISIFLLLAHPSVDYERYENNLYQRACHEPCRARLDFDQLRELRAKAHLGDFGLVLLGPIAWTYPDFGSQVSGAGVFMTAVVAALINAGFFLCRHTALRIVLVAAGLVGWLMQGCLTIVIGI